MRRLALTMSVLLGGCSLMAPPADGMRQVSIEGQAYQLSQLTEGTWTMAPVRAEAPPLNPRSRADLVNAVETASGCKVTDSDFSQQGRQFDAQVDCAARIKN
ncbi:MAG: hypothetical protein EOO28_01250 [Comamonadaceae bacterium]|nr:MAG: hypothetical protein EOO28_01250 [Comamonadaceae bacterium]